MGNGNQCKLQACDFGMSYGVGLFRKIPLINAMDQSAVLSLFNLNGKFSLRKTGFATDIVDRARY